MHSVFSKGFIPAALLCSALLSCAPSGPKDGQYTIKVLSTNDVHSSWFDSTYTGGGVKKSLYGASYVIDSVRNSSGAQNVLLIDAGDCLQGDNATYYYNYVDTASRHLYPRLVKYMGYDAITVGNHDIETGHPVYDRVAKELKDEGIPFLGGNAFDTRTGKTYFPLYKVFSKGGLRVLVLGYTNPDISSWLMEDIWKGITFKSLLPLVQHDVDSLVAKEKPHVVVVSVHSGVGKGDGSILESQGMDLFKSLKGVDFLLCSHDHIPRVEQAPDSGMCLMNSGSHCRYVAEGTITVDIKDGKVQGRKRSAHLLPIDAHKVNTSMRDAFREDFLKVKSFSTKPLGDLEVTLRSSDGYKGMNPYIDLIHTVCLESTDADISFAAPLTYDGSVKAGPIIYNDLSVIYPYENTLFTVRLKGSQIKDYLEESYDRWIQDPSKDGHLLKITLKEDHVTGKKSWGFVNRSYNFDSAAGIVYTVDIDRPAGQRVDIKSMADGTPFDPEKTYKVAMTSYRASGGGNLLTEGAHLGEGEVWDLVEGKYPEIRNLLYKWVLSKGGIKEEDTSDPATIGYWEFVPKAKADALLDKDMALMFGN